MGIMNTTATEQYCKWHHHRETGLSCHKCSAAIWWECAREAEIGYWCRSCDDAWRKKHRLPKPNLQQRHSTQQKATT
jgi:hypothetical protein